VPDWLDWITIDVFQSVVLAAATLLAFLTYLGEKDARADAAVKRRLDHIASRVAELAGATTHSTEVPGQGWRVLVAKRNLQSALMASPVSLPETSNLSHAARIEVEHVDAALEEIDNALTARTK
jgi:hypothetical protein